MWSKWLKGTIGAIALTSAVAFSLAASGTNRPFEATVEMEQLAAKLEHAKAIHPKTAHEIRRLIGQPRYDCNQVACSAQLEGRNSAVRKQLEALIAKKYPLDNFANKPSIVNSGLSTTAKEMGR